MHTPTSPLPAGLLVGWKAGEAPSGFGFSRQEVTQVAAEEGVAYTGEGHLMTIAPTGAGKGVSCVIPAIVQHQGPVVVMDVKGENYAITHAHRRATGGAIHCIDPFGVTAGMEGAQPGDISGFNPFDLLPYLSEDEDTACRALADLLLSKTNHNTDPFWREASVGVLAGLIQCYNSMEGPMRSLCALVADLSIEMPDAKAIGHIDAQTAFLSGAHSDTEMTQAIHDAGLEPEEVWAVYAATMRAHSPSWRPGAREVASLVEEAVAHALTTYPKGVAKASIKNAAEGVAIEVLESGGHFARFRRTLTLQQAAGFAPGMLDQIWEALTTSNLAPLDWQTTGSYSAQWAMDDGVPENFPLAMHRVALHPTALCRGVAAQPGTVDRTWGSILCTLRAELAEFSGAGIRRAFNGPRAIDLEALWRGDDQSIYIVFPPARIRSHANLFRCIVEGLLGVIVARSHRPQTRTLFLLDEVAQLGTLPLLITATTLLRGYGVQVWTFWQDIAQLRANYPRDWQTILNNCKVVQIFGRTTGALVQDLAQALDVHPAALVSLKPEDMLAWVDSHSPQVLRRPLSYADAALRVRCAHGPFAPSAPPALPRAPRLVRRATPDLVEMAADVLDIPPSMDPTPEAIPPDLVAAQDHAHPPSSA